MITWQLLVEKIEVIAWKWFLEKIGNDNLTIAHRKVELIENELVETGNGCLEIARGNQE